jgi:hypothetical protein
MSSISRVHHSTLHKFFCLKALYFFLCKINNQADLNSSFVPIFSPSVLESIPQNYSDTMTHSISRYWESKVQPIFGVLALSMTIFAYFIYLSNSLTTVAEAFWSDCNHTWKSLWGYLLNRYGESRMFSLLTPALSALLYLMISGCFFVVDYFQIPSFLTVYKTQPGKNEPLEM